MTVSPIYTVHCDECSAWVAQTGTTAQARRIAKGAHWKRCRREGRIVDLCPVCAEVPCIEREFSVCEVHESWFADEQTVCHAALEHAAVKVQSGGTTKEASDGPC